MLSTASAAAAADTLVGENGDRIRGRIIEQKDGQLVFESDAFGRVQLASDRVTVVRDQPAAAPTPAPRVAEINPLALEVGLKVGADRGSLETREDEVDATFRFAHSREAGELHGNVTYGYTRLEGRLKDDDMAASLSYDHWQSKEHFLAGRVIGSSDLVEDGYDVTRTLSAAWGWRLFETDNRFLRIGPALGYLWLERGPETFNGAALGLHARAMGPVVGQVSYTGELQLLDSLDDGRYANLDLRIHHPLSARLQIGLVWRYLWSDVRIDSGISSEWRWEITWRSRLDARP